MAIAVNAQLSLTNREFVGCLAVAALFVGLRVAGWLNSPELENHDSVAYLFWAQTFKTGDWHTISELPADATPLFPILTALVSFVVPGIENAARLVSLLASVASMAAVYLIGRRAISPLGGILAVLLFAASPHIFRMSYGVLTEPLYIALFSLIVLTFMMSADKPTIKSAMVMGLLCGMAFLTRFEAVLLLLAVPFLYFSHAFLLRRGQPVKPTVQASVAFVLVAMAIAAPQVLHVSGKMNSFSLSGRSVWTVVLSNPDGKSYDEKLSGLDYDPKMRNIRYLQANPDALQALVRESGYGEVLVEYARTAARNLRFIHNSQLVNLVGLPVVVFAAIGFFALLRSARETDAALLASFIALALIAPVLYQVSTRHLLILVPFLCVFAAAGLIESAKTFASRLLGTPRAFAPMLALFVIVTMFLPFRQTAAHIAQPDNFNRDYEAENLAEPGSLIRRHAADEGRRAKVLLRKWYLAYFADAYAETTPYTDLAGLLHYLEGREFDFFFYEEKFLHEYPFAAELDSPAWQSEFRTVYSSEDNGLRQVLYAVRNDRRDE